MSDARAEADSGTARRIALVVTEGYVFANPIAPPVCGVARITLYEALWTGRASDDLCAVLTPPVRAHEAGKLRFKRTSRHGDRPNRWEILEP